MDETNEAMWAKRELLSRSEPPSTNYLCRVARGISAMVGPLEAGADATVVADILLIYERNAWCGVLDGDRKTASNPFEPSEKTAALQSFIPTSLTPAQEVPVRALSEATCAKNPLVAARLADVLFVRFGQRTDALTAIDALLLAQVLYSGEEGWTELVAKLARSAQLVLTFRDEVRLRAVLDGFEDAGRRILAGRFLFAFPRLADALATLILASKWGRSRFGQAAQERWALTLEWIAARYDSEDRFHAQASWKVSEFWSRKTGDVDAQRRAQRALIRSILDEADEREPLVVPMIIENAIAVGLAFGHKDLTDEAKRRMGPAIRAAEAVMASRSFSIPVPDEYVTRMREILARAPSISIAVRHLASIATTFPVAYYDRAAEQSLSEFVFANLLPRIHYRQGMVVFRSDGPESKKAEAMAEYASIHLAQVEAMLDIFLRDTLDVGRFAVTTLYDAVSEWPVMDPGRRPFLLRASERYASSDWISSGLIVATVYEALLRSLVRASGHHALKVDANGIQSFETLGTMLRQPALRAALTEDHVWFVEHVLCRPHLGPNVRNEAAHGSLEASQLTRARVLLLWLFVIRLTNYGPAVPLEVTSADTQQAMEQGDDCDDETS
jgi:hypothetical protein